MKTDGPSFEESQFIGSSLSRIGMHDTLVGLFILSVMSLLGILCFLMLNIFVSV